MSDLQEVKANWDLRDQKDTQVSVDHEDVLAHLERMVHQDLTDEKENEVDVDHQGPCTMESFPQNLPNRTPFLTKRKDQPDQLDPWEHQDQEDHTEASETPVSKEKLEPEESQELQVSWDHEVKMVLMVSPDLVENQEQ